MRVSLHGTWMRRRSFRTSPSVHASVRFWFRYAKPEILRKQAKIPPIQRPEYSATNARVKRRGHPIVSSIKGRLCSFEFWLGLVAGAATRIATKLAIESALASAYGTNARAMIDFAACAGAGMAAGFIVHLVRIYYRNSKLRKEQKEKYFGAAAIKSAITGLLGGTIGGCATNLFSLLASSNMLSIGASVGALTSLPLSVAKSIKAYRRNAAGGWRSWALRSAVYGAAGSVLGLAFADAVAMHEAFAASLEEGGNTMQVAPPASLLLSHAWPGTLHASAGFAPPQSVLSFHATHPSVWHPHHTVHHALHGHTHHAHRHWRHTARKPVHHRHVVQYAHDSRQYLHHLREVRGRYYTHLAALNQERLIESHHLARLTAARQLDIKGPCADPRMACVERVYFNPEGDATKVVLEPARGLPQVAHFEVQRAAMNANWNSAAEGQTAGATPDASKVSLIVPFNRAAAPSFT